MPVVRRGRHRRKTVATLVVAIAAVPLAAGAALVTPVLVLESRFDTAQSTAPTATAAAGQPGASALTTPDSTGRPKATKSATSTPTLTPTVTTRPRSAPTTSATTSSQYAAFENTVIELTNAERVQAGCPALRLDTRLRLAARRHSADMARYGYFSHTGRDGSSPGDRIAAAGYPSNVGWAENIAFGYSTPQAVVAAWMRSEGHRRNILNCRLAAIGVGVAPDSRGRLYWTQVFGGR